MDESYLVVPTNRMKNLEKFIFQWACYFSDRNIQMKFIVVEDNKTRSPFGFCRHYSWKEIDEDLRGDSWIISRGDSAIRSYGFLVAHRLGAKYIFTLDDDCLPEKDEDYYARHIDKLENTTRWTELVLGQRSRGIPYRNLGKLKVVANIGLWTNSPDLDAIQTLSGGTFNMTGDVDRILPSNQFFPFSGMNFVLAREVACLAYFPLMGKSSEFKRFDDIWFGVIFKKICDHLGYSVSCGHPFVKHIRASDPFVNLVKEAPGVSYNESFWEEVDRVVLTGKTPLECLYEVANGIGSNSYLRTLSKAIKVWGKYFQVKESPPV